MGSGQKSTDRAASNEGPASPSSCGRSGVDLPQHQQSQQEPHVTSRELKLEQDAAQGSDLSDGPDLLPVHLPMQETSDADSDRALPDGQGAAASTSMRAKGGEAPASGTTDARQALASPRQAPSPSDVKQLPGPALAPIFAKAKPKQTKLPHPSEQRQSETPPPSPLHISTKGKAPGTPPMSSGDALARSHAQQPPEHLSSQGLTGSGQAVNAGNGALAQHKGGAPFGPKGGSKMEEASPHVIASPTAVLSSLTEYDAVGMAPWKLGEKVPYLHIARAFQAIDGTTKRLRIGDALANMFRSILALSPGDRAQLPRNITNPGKCFALGPNGPWWCGMSLTASFEVPRLSAVQVLSCEHYKCGVSSGPCFSLLVSSRILALSCCGPEMPCCVQK